MSNRNKDNGDYVKYQHVERLGSDEVGGIMIGEVYVFPKIDGTNAHAWWDGEQMHYGSRTRELSLDKDNAGFMQEMSECKELNALCMSVPGAHVFGEWLVPHSLKTYRADAWRKLYIFDIVEKKEDECAMHWHYDDLKALCDEHDVEYIPPIRIIQNPTVDNLMKVLEQNQYLVQDGEGNGEGIVCKNYSFVNKYGRQTWAKIVTSEFKEKHHKEMGAPKTLGTKMVEQEMVERYVTAAEVQKAIAKIRLERDGWNSKCIPQLLQTVYHDLVQENIWDACKRWKQPTINFKNLNRFCVMKIKEISGELF